LGWETHYQLTMQRLHKRTKISIFIVTLSAHVVVWTLILCDRCCCAGREYDKDGVLKPWWESDVITRFNETAQCFVEQYSKYTSNGEHVSISSVVLVEFVAKTHTVKC